MRWWNDGFHRASADGALCIGGQFFSKKVHLRWVKYQKAVAQSILLFGRRSVCILCAAESVFTQAIALFRCSVAGGPHLYLDAGFRPQIFRGIDYKAKNCRCYSNPYRSCAGGNQMIQIIGSPSHLDSRSGNYSNPQKSGSS